MRDRLATLAELLHLGTKQRQRRFLLPVLILTLAGLVIALGAAYPLLSPFLYSMF